MRITDEIKAQINRLYAENHNKSLTARTLGISVASVNKYLIPDYVPTTNHVVPPFDKMPSGCEGFVEYACWGKCGEILRLSAAEQEELKILLREGI